MQNHSGIRDAMLATIPNLRAFAISLTNRNRDQADDLVQSTLTKALASIDRFEPGTNIRAWLITILRNEFYSSARKRKHEGQDRDDLHATRLATAPEQHWRLDLQDMWAALAKVRLEHREALLLVAAEGMSYDEAAQVCGVPAGTVKSRVHRARMDLARLLKLEGQDELRPDRTMQAAIQGSLLQAAA